MKQIFTSSELDFTSFSNPHKKEQTLNDLVDQASWRGLSSYNDLIELSKAESDAYFTLFITGLIHEFIAKPYEVELPKSHFFENSELDIEKSKQVVLMYIGIITDQVKKKEDIKMKVYRSQFLYALTQLGISPHLLAERFHNFFKNACN
ncbi:MAG TPA: hypothetical protein DCL21_03660 [Alphaproteobacteria bacterium]|nr:hypothetical protein [Alphaproteobacteria bacterium]